MHHHDHHSHSHTPPTIGRTFIFCIVLNLLFVAIEAGYGWWSGSLALLTDAGHNLSDVGSLALAWLAFRLLRVRPNPRYSYGLRKSTILASLINALILLLAVGALGYEALYRLQDPPPVPGLVMAAVAAVGILINGFSAWLLNRDQHDDLNVRGAYLHMAADAAVSAGVVIAGLAIYYTGWRWLDPVISFVVLGVILWGTWDLLRESLRLSLDGVPYSIEPDLVRNTALKIPGVRDLHHLHIWAISTSENALTAHLVLDEGLSTADVNQIKHQFRHELEHLAIQHVTLETETAKHGCAGAECL